MSVQTITSLPEFESLLNTTTYVVADFYADWCPPCKAIAPLYSNLATQHGKPGKLAFAKINVDHVGDVAAKYGITAMPTFLFFEKGSPYEGRSMIRGADPRSLQTVVQELAGKAAAENDEAKDETTVSGGYELTGESGKRADWKTSLNA